MPDITVEVTQSDITANVTSPNITANVTSADVAANVTTTDVTANVEAANVTVNITGGGSPHIIQDEGVAETQRANLNFVGAGVSVSDDSANNATVVTISGGGGGTWGGIGGNLPDQTDLQTALDGKVDENAAITGATKTKITYDAKGLVTAGADAAIADITGLQTALDGKAASSHTHALSDITQSGATTNQVPKWNGSAWVPANEAGGADGNGIYSGSGTVDISGGDVSATLTDHNAGLRFNYANGIAGIEIVNNQAPSDGYAQIKNPQETAFIYADQQGAVMEASGGFSMRISADGVAISGPSGEGASGQVWTADGAGYGDWQTPAGGGASVTEITYADMQTAITNGTLTPGGWYLITDAAGTDLGFLTNAVNENTINVQGVGGYLNADFQAVGDYSNTPETFGAQLGIWRTGFEVVTINYLNLAGGTFAVGDTITGDSTAATAVIVTDDGAASMTAYMTSAGVAFDGSEVLDNGNGVTADQDGAASSPTIVQGDVVIWNLTHYQLTDATLLDGTNPATNTAAYTALAKGDYPEPYVTAWDVSEYDFPNDSIQYRQDLRGGLVRGAAGIAGYQFGRDACTGNNIQSPDTFDIRNLVASFNNNTTFPGATVSEIATGTDTLIENNILENGGQLTGITAGESCSIRGNTVGQGATLGGGTTMGDGVEITSNEIVSGASIGNISAGDGAIISANYVGAAGSIYGVSLQDFCSISGTNLGVGAEISDVALQFDGVTGGRILYCEFPAGARLSNKTFGESLIFSNTTFGLFSDEIEMISENIQNKRAIPGFSDIPATIDITGSTTLDCTAAFAQYRGIYNLTSSNPTENIDTITNPPTQFPFTIRPAAGLVLTITGTAYAGIAAGQIALKAASYTLNPGEYIVLEYEAATGALIENRVVNALL